MTEFIFSIEKDISRTDVSGDKVYDMAMDKRNQVNQSTSDNDLLTYYSVLTPCFVCYSVV